ncbi:MAG: hypothetical protein L6Q37_08600 [Bdellovibrionaceae bacterium]|nr:hypothetical protein [Pseudobdellovibrionaceae bacterium]NUM57864.1 hypothetical protein [Pseudobdellovibrionaceae bacterium]
MKINKKLKDTFLFGFILFSTSAFAGGNISGGGNPYNITEGALNLLLEGQGLKKAMINYLITLPVNKIEDLVVRNLFNTMMKDNSLIKDISKTKYLISESCKDSANEHTPASTLVGQMGSDICFNTKKLVSTYKDLNEEEVMVKLASLAFHEHTHHYQRPDKEKMSRNEEDANRLSGYVMITAKFVQLPLLKWSNPGNGPIEFQEIQSLFEIIKAKEQRFLTPRPEDFKNYLSYYSQKDSGVFKILPREKYDDKMSIRGGGAYYSFKYQDHQYGYGSNVELSMNQLSSGFAGCDFGYLVSLGNVELDEINETHPALKFLYDFKPADSEPDIRKQQSRREFEENGFNYSERTKFKIGEVFGLRSVNFGETYGSDLLVVFKIIKQYEDGSLLIVWKKIKEFPSKNCT